MTPINFVSTVRDITNHRLTTSLSQRCFEQLSPDAVTAIEINDFQLEYVIFVYKYIVQWITEDEILLMVKSLNKGKTPDRFRPDFTSQLELRLTSSCFILS